MQPKLIVLAGAAGAGKSTIAAELVKHGYQVIKFAAPLKNMLRALGLSEAEIEGDLKEQPCALLGGRTPRHAMQTLGTEWGRGCIGAEVWVSAWKREVDRVLAAGGRVVVDDCRFQNELAAALVRGGGAVRLVRAGAGTVPHASEVGLAGLALPEIINDREPSVVAAEILAMDWEPMQCLC